MKKNLVFKLPALAIILSVCSISCNEDYVSDNLKNTDEVSSITTSSIKEQNMTNFANILSKVVYDNKDVRNFLKLEALKQFDENYDVLYHSVKDKSINGKSFREILISYSSEKEINEIEKNVPLLNILLPEIKIFNVSPEDLDINDPEIPIAISTSKEIDLYLNGKVELHLNKNSVPDFHTFVVNENSRVLDPTEIGMSSRNKSNNQIVFKSPNFDRRRKQNENMLKRFSGIRENDLDKKLIDAYKYFNRDDGSDRQMALQRDYIYYGITPYNTSGNLNRSVSEYISYIEINPRAYEKIANKKDKSNKVDPYLIQNVHVQRRSDLSPNDLINTFWTKGGYDFKFTIINSENDVSTIYFPFKPHDIWNFNHGDDYTHPTFFRHTKHVYSMYPENFTAKRVHLNPEDISLGNWNISTEPLFKYIIIEEEDPGTETTSVDTYDLTHMNSNKFNGDAKLEIGFGEKFKINGGGVSTEISNSNSVHTSKQVTIKTTTGSDPLGKIKIYYYHPIIIGKENNEYILNSYNTGYVKFGVGAR